MLTLLHRIYIPIPLLRISFWLLFLWSMHCWERQSSMGLESLCTLLLSVANFKDNTTYHIHSIHLGSSPLPVGLEAGAQHNSFLCLRFKLSCSHLLSRHPWSRGTCGGVEFLPDMHIHKDQKQNSIFTTNTQRSRLFHHPLSIYVLELKRSALQGSRGNWEGIMASVLIFSFENAVHLLPLCHSID